MADDLKIIIQASLDTSTKAIGDLNNQINEIAKKVSGLNLNVKVDSQNLNQLTNQIEIISKQLSQTKKIEVVDSSSISNGQKLYATLQEVMDEYSKLGKVKITNETLNPITKELESFSIAVENADKKIEKLKFDMLNVANGDNISKMFTPTKLNQVNPIESNNKALERMLDEAYRMNADFDKKAEALDKIHWQALRDDQAREEALDKMHYLALQKNRELDLKAQEQANKDAEALDRAHFNAIRDNNKRIEDMDKLHYLALQKNKEYDTKQTQEQQKLGTNTSLISSVSGSTNVAGFKQLAQSVAGADAELIKVTTRLDKTFGSIQEMNVRVKEGEKYWRNYTVSVVEATGEVYKLDRGLTTASQNLTLGDKLKEMAKSIPLWFGGMTLFMSGIHFIEDFAKSISEIDAKMAGYVQTNEAYFNSEQKINDETHKFIQTTHDLGAELDSVLESARLYGRMYKDVNVVQELVRQSTKLSTIDLVSLGDATKGMEAILAQYHVQLNNVNDAQVIGNNLLDKFSKVAHDSAIPAKDLLAAYERMGSVANQTGVSVDFMNGLLASGFRNTALSGENLGNMWKTVLGNIHTDKAVSEIERLGVATKEVVNGTEQWRKAEDILLDLSVKVIGKNEDLTKSYEDIARGVYQYQKLAASLDLGSIVQGQAASINSVGSTSQYLVTQMDTIERKSKQVRATMLELFNTAGDDGLRNSIKSILDVVDQFLIGLSKVPSGVYEIIGVLGGLGTAYLALKNPVSSLITAIGVLTTSNVTNTTTTTAQTVATEASTVATTAKTVATEGATVAVNTMTAAEARSAVTLAAATAGASILVGVLAAYVMNAGEATKAEKNLNDERDKSISAQEQQYMQAEKQIQVIPQWVNLHNELTKALESGTLSAEGQTKAKNDLDKVSKALADTIGQEGFAQLQAAQFTDQATQQIIQSLIKRKAALKQSMLDTLNEDSSSLSDRELSALQKRNEANRELDKLNGQSDDAPFGDLAGTGALNAINRKKNIDKFKKQQEEANKELDDIKRKNQEIEDKKITVTADLINLNNLNGESGKTQGETTKDIKANFDNQMADFRHLVNMKAQGYTDAVQQLDKLNQIRDQFADKLSDKDLYGIDEEIQRAKDGIGLKAKGYPAGSSSVTAPSIPTVEDVSLQKESLQLAKSAYEVTKQNIDLLDKKAKNYEKEKNYSDAIKTTNDLLIAQKQALVDLDTAKNNVSKDADSIRNDPRFSSLGNKFSQDGKSFDAWFDSQGNASKEYLDYIQKLQTEQYNLLNGKDKLSKSEEKENKQLAEQIKTAKQVFDALQVQKKGYVELTKEQDALRESTNATNISLEQLAFDNSKNWITEQKTLGLLPLQDEEAAWKRVAEAHQDNAKMRIEAEKEIKRVHDETVKAELADIDKQIQASKDLDGVYDKTSSSYRDHLTDEINLIKQKNDVLNNETEQILKSNTLTDLQIAQLANYNKILADNQKAIHEDESKKMQSVIDEQNTHLKNLDAQIQASDTRLKMYEEGSKNNKQLDVQKYDQELLNNIDIIKQRIAAEKQHEQTIRDQMTTVGLTESEWKSLNDQLRTSIDTQIKLTQSIQDANDKLKTQLNNVADQVIAVYKKFYDTQKKLSTDSITAEKKALDDQHQDLVKNLDTEIKKYEERYKAQVRQIDEVTATEDYNQQLKKLQDEAATYTKQLNAMQMDDSTDAKAKRVELQTQLATKTDEINKLTRDREKTLRKQSLQDELDAKKQELTAQKDSSTFAIDQLNQQYQQTHQYQQMTYQDAVDYLDKQKTASEQYYSDLVNNEEKFTQIRNQILQGNFAQVQSDFAQFSSFLQSNSQAIGQNISSSILSTMNSLTTTMNTISMVMGNNLSILQSKLGAVGTGVTSQVTTAVEGLLTKLKELDQLKFTGLTNSLSQVDQKFKDMMISAMQANAAAYNMTSDANQQKSLHDKNVALGSILGLTYDPSGVWKDAQGNIVVNAMNGNTTPPYIPPTPTYNPTPSYNSGGGSYSENVGGTTYTSDRPTIYNGGGEGSPMGWIGDTPIYHTGGEVGKPALAPDEMPAILKLGEYVYTEAMQSKLREIISRPINFLSKIANSLPSMSMPNLATASPSAGGNKTFNMSVNIGTVTGDKKGVDFFMNEVRKEVNKLGGDFDFV
ncbi:hypothetical protein [Paenibacillus cremeus]|uniref:Phage tail tape measure protein n=1 Tax=Paenibacillus cremeus TaxID=2163881 RepID=A0A559KCZ8_9BACL|nr:hypothetical protein [Paenibacillus cremeus]TVY09984.1 hypothetical protein FPZ49_11475 [Paenibacillus cremeus]